MNPECERHITVGSHGRQPLGVKLIHINDVLGE